MEAQSNFKRFFDTENVTSYWKNQCPPKKGELFTDPIFPPNQNSIFGLDDNGNYINPELGPNFREINKRSEIEWKRVNDIFQEYLLFEESIVESDIRQGNIADDYFISAVGALCKFPNLIYHLFKRKQVNPDGYYEVIFYLDGELQIVVVDDHLPVIKGTNNLRFGRPYNNDIWAIILEKAWAKVHRGYANISGGRPSDVFQALTGFATEEISHQGERLCKLWDILKSCGMTGGIMCSSTIEDPKLDKMGIVGDHTYTIIGYQTVKYKGMDVRLLRVRNPWGFREWNGDWSDKSPLWTDESKENVDYSLKDDGVFWISIKDYEKYYWQTDVCYIMHDCKIKHFIIDGDDTRVPHVFNIYLEKKEQASFSVIKKFWKFSTELPEIKLSSRLIIAKYTPSNLKIEKLEGSFESSKNCAISRIFEAGYYVAWVYVTQTEKELKPYHYKFKFASQSPFKLKHVNTDNNFDFLKELMTSAIKDAHPEILKKKHEVSYLLEHDFHQTGLGFRYIYNPRKTKYQIWSNNASELVNISLLPPFENSLDFEFSVPPHGETICLGWKIQSGQKCWFNLKSVYKAYRCNEGEAPTNTKKINLKDYLSENVRNCENDYDYVSISSEEANRQLTFPQICMLDVLKKQHPDLMEKILEILPITDETNLQWAKKIYPDGFYLGLTLDYWYKHGRGAFCGTDRSIWIGYWKKGKKHRYGKELDSSLKVIFEGEYKNGEKNGKGTMSYPNGDKIYGVFVNNKITGEGIFYWANGSKWEGNFIDGQMHGLGMYYDIEGNSSEIAYSKGLLVN